MAGTTKTKAAPKKTTAKKAAPAAEVEEVEEDEAPAKRGRNDDVTFGASDLAELLTERTGKKVTTRELRTLLRKMARDGRINREIIPGNRSRYDWSGPEDEEVQAVIEAFEGGELEKDKQEKLAALKERKAQQKAAKEAAAAEEDEDEEEETPKPKTRRKAATKTKAKAKPAPVEDDEDLELEDDEEE